MITARGLTKRYGRTVAVRDLTFTVRPGVVTGFLGPNGAGKSTTMRMLIGLDRPDAGRATVNGKPYRELRLPLREVGAMLKERRWRSRLLPLGMHNAAMKFLPWIIAVDSLTAVKPVAYSLSAWTGLAMLCLYAAAALAAGGWALLRADA